MKWERRVWTEDGEVLYLHRHAELGCLEPLRVIQGGRHGEENVPRGRRNHWRRLADLVGRPDRHSDLRRAVCSFPDSHHAYGNH